MHIKTTNITDFIQFIINATQNGEKFPRVIHGYKKAPPSFATTTNYELKYTKFVFALFTNKLTVIYEDKVLTEEYDEIFEKLSNYRNNDADFRIQIYETVKYDRQKKELLVERELHVI